MRSRKVVDDPKVKIKPLSAVKDKPLKEGPQHKCEVCAGNKYGCQWQEIGKYWVCPSCLEQVKVSRINELLDVEAAELERLDKSVILDERELRGCRADGLPLRWYILFALRIDGVGETPVDVDIKKFAKKWGVDEDDVLIHAHGFSKKGVIRINLPKVNAQIFTYDQRVKMLESAAKK